MLISVLGPMCHSDATAARVWSAIREQSDMPVFLDRHGRVSLDWIAAVCSCVGGNVTDAMAVVQWCRQLEQEADLECRFPELPFPDPLHYPQGLCGAGWQEVVPA